MALTATTFFMLRRLLALFFGADTDVDTGHLHDAGSDTSFGFFSLLSILAFFMGSGWMGQTCRVDWEVGGLASAAAATAFAFSFAFSFAFDMMMLASGLMFTARKLDRTIEYDLKTAVGRTAGVYMTIPKQGAGRGQVEVDVSGRRKTLEAISTGEKLDQFSSVTVVEVRDDQTLVVESTD